MKIQLDWLKQYVDCPLPALALGDLLTMSGLEIESYETVTLPDGTPTEVLELNVTPNRGYCLSHIGVAREVAALTGKTLKIPDAPPAPNPKGGDITQRLTVTVEEPELCPRYAALVIDGVRVGPSPQWLADRLRAVGLRPINNVVDITNFVLMEYGQPLHAFDLNLLRDHRILVRRAKAGEAFSALDGTQLKLETEALVIADAQRPVALAGVMGSDNSQVSETTTAVALESACFDPLSVRKTSKHYALRSDSSYRFERGVDIDAVLTAQSRAALLIQEIAGGRILQGRIDIYPKPRPTRQIDFRIERCNQILGTELPASAIVTYLEALGMQVAPTNAPGTHRVTTPAFRPMLEREIDLIEEVARLHGYDRIEVSSPTASLKPVRFNTLQRVRLEARDLMRGLGFSEAVNYSFLEDEYARAFLSAYAETGAETVALDNPISLELGTLRTSLLPGLIKTAVRNIHHGQKSLRLFELGQAFFRTTPGEHTERPSLGALLSGPRPVSVWNPAGQEYDFYDMKGILETLLSHFKVTPEIQPCARPYLTPGPSVEARVQGRPVAVLGVLHPKTAAQLGLEQAASVMELNLEALTRALPGAVRFEPLPRFPGTYRDISILVDKTVSSQAICDVIAEAGRPLLRRVALYDRFEGKKLEPGKKSLTFALMFQSPDRTLTDDEVNPVFGAIVDNLGEKLGARLRD